MVHVTDLAKSTENVEFRSHFLETSLGTKNCLASALLIRGISTTQFLAARVDHSYMPVLLMNGQW